MFVRNRTLTFPKVVLYLANFIKGSHQDELDQLFQAIEKTDVPREAVTRSALCQARKKVSYLVFIALQTIICNFINARVALQTFKGFRVFAIDGSTLKVPDNEELRGVFGTLKFKKEDHKVRAMARVSLLHDVLNRVTYDAILSRYRKSENKLAEQHLATVDLPDNSLILLDRGYVDFALLSRIVQMGHSFCVRAKANLNIVKDFKKSGLNQGVYLFKPTARSKKVFPKGSPFRDSIKVRLVRFHINNECYILMTNLIDSTQYSIEDLAMLYHQRWEVEESYKVKKERLRIGSFSGLSHQAVLQDFHAKVFAECLTVVLSLETEEYLTDYNITTNDEYQVSLTQALAKMKNSIVHLFEKPYRRLLKEINTRFCKCLVAMVPGRKYCRDGLKTRGMGKDSMAYKHNR